MGFERMVSVLQDKLSNYDTDVFSPLSNKIGSFFSKIVPTVVEQMGDIFPEIRQKKQDVIKILDEEEEAFALALDRGEVHFNKCARRCQDNRSTNFPGEVVWFLYETYGFPEDLTKLMAVEQGLKINDEEVSAAREKALEASKGKKKGASDLVALDVHDIATLEKMNDVASTDDIAKYQTGVLKSTIKAIYYGNGFLKSTADVSQGEIFGVLLDKTNSHAESGGQLSDTGRVMVGSLARMDVTNVQSYGRYVLHAGYIEYGSLSVGDEVLAEYDELRRQHIPINHTGTHILNFALREVLGRDVEQKRSLVSPEKLRFDFSHKAPVTDEEIKRIEEISDKYIKDDQEVFAQDVDLTTAGRIEGVRAVFGETYPDPVRVVSIGVPVDKLVSDVVSKDWWKYSIELCEGTHVKRTGEIKQLVVLEESGNGKGIRCIVAVTGQAAVEVRQAARIFDERLTRLEQMASSPEKECFYQGDEGRARQAQHLDARQEGLLAALWDSRQGNIQGVEEGPEGPGRFGHPHGQDALRARQI